MGDRYSFSLTTFSPSGKLVQIEHALAAVAQGACSVGIKGKNGVVICTEKKMSSSLMDAATLDRVSVVCPNVGFVYSGMGPDARILLQKSRKCAQKYKLVHGEYPPCAILVKDIASIMQEFTQRGGVRPFGVSLLVAGYDECQGPMLYQVDPSGSYFAWKATAIGKNYVNIKTFLEKRVTENMELEDAVHTAILALKESFEGVMTADNIEIGIVDTTAMKTTGDHHLIAFTKLSEAEIQDYLTNI